MQHGGPSGPPFFFGVARAGRDEIGSIDETVHGREMPARVLRVGVLVEEEG